MKVLVTGATGFIGSHLLPMLHVRGVSVRAMIERGQDNTALRQWAVEVVNGDVRDAKSLTAAVAEVDAVFHLAGILAARSRRHFEMVSRLSRRPSLFNVDKMREALAGSWTCSASRIERELGFSVAGSLAERLSQTAGWYASQGLL